MNSLEPARSGGSCRKNFEKKVERSPLRQLIGETFLKKKIIFLGRLEPSKEAIFFLNFSWIFVKKRIMKKQL